MKYLIYTPFRCGSSFVTHFIRENLHISSPTFMNDVPDVVEENAVFKNHNIDMSVYKHILFDHIITCIRKPTDIFMSAYIKDFKTPDYPYTYENEPCVKNVDDMVDHFLSFDWSSFDWCSYDYNFKQIQQLTDLDIWKLPVNVETGVSYYPGKPALTIVTHRTLFNDNYFQHFQQFCSTQFKFKNLTRGTFSYRNADTYGDLYSLFKSKIPQSFFEKYKDLDNQIISKFF